MKTGCQRAGYEISRKFSRKKTENFSRKKTENFRLWNFGVAARPRRGGRADRRVTWTVAAMARGAYAPTAEAVRLRARAEEIFAQFRKWPTSGNPGGERTGVDRHNLPGVVVPRPGPVVGPFFSSLFDSIHSHVINLLRPPYSAVIWTCFLDYLPRFFRAFSGKFFTKSSSFLYLIYTIM